MYQIIINGQEQWLTLDEAKKAYYNGLFFVKIGELVLESADVERKITDEERQQLASPAS